MGLEAKTFLSLSGTASTRPIDTDAAPAPAPVALLLPLAPTAEVDPTAVPTTCVHVYVGSMKNGLSGSVDKRLCIYIYSESVYREESIGW